MTKYPTPRPRTITDRSTRPYLCFGASVLASLEVVCASPLLVVEVEPVDLTWLEEPVEVVLDKVVVAEEASVVLAAALLDVELELAMLEEVSTRTPPEVLEAEAEAEADAEAEAEALPDELPVAEEEPEDESEDELPELTDLPPQVID